MGNRDRRRKTLTIVLALLTVVPVACSSGSGVPVASGPTTSSNVSIVAAARIRFRPSSVRVALGHSREVDVEEAGYNGKFTSGTSASAKCTSVATWTPRKGKGPKLKVTVRGKSDGTCEIYFRDDKSKSNRLKITVASLTTPTPSPSPSPSPSPTPSPTPTPTPIPIGTPQALGNAYVDVTDNLSLAVATTQTAPRGSSIIAIGAESIGSGQIVTNTGSCSDSDGDTFTASQLSFEGGDYIICSSNPIAAPLGTGAYVTVSWTNTASTSRYNQRAAAWYVTGLATSPVDQTVTGYGNSASVSIGPTTTTSQANELLFGLVGDRQTASAAAFSAGTNGTSNPCEASGTPGYLYLGGFGTTAWPSIFATYCVVNATGAYELQATLSSSFWDAVLTTLKGASP